MLRPEQIFSCRVLHERLQINLDAATVSIVPISASCIRVQVDFDNSQPLNYGLASTQEADTSLLADWKAALQDQMPVVLIGAEITLPLSDKTLIVHQQPFYLELKSAETILYRDLPGRAYQVDRNLRRWHYHQREDSHLHYGLGEKAGRLERTGRSFKMTNTDAIGYDPEHGDPLYKHIPFLLRLQPETKTCIGLYYHNASPSSFDVGSERSGYYGSFSSFCCDDGLIDYFLLLGETPREVCKRYVALTGYPALPTKASLGYWGSSMFYTELEADAGAAVLNFIDECQRQQIPISGFHLSSGYSKAKDGKRYTFHWNAGKMSDAAHFIRQMNERRVALSPNVKPAFLTQHPLYETFRQAGAFVKSHSNEDPLKVNFWGGEGSLVDFSNPEARNLWQTQLSKAFLQHGVAAIWNDNNEFEADDDDAICHADGTPESLQKLRPVLSNLMAETTWDAITEQSAARPFILSRAGFVGIQRWAQTWSGDNASSWQHFRFNVATMLGQSLSGIAFNGMDIGGFSGLSPEPALLLRWVQNGIFHPRFCIHSVNADNTVTEPWMYREILPYIRQAIRFRYQLLPTLYSFAYGASRDGDPLVRPLVYQFPDDSNGWHEDQAFMVGDALLTLAITEPDITHYPLYFPEGTWKDWYTGKLFEGNKTHRLNLELEYSPLFMRVGSGVFLDQAYDHAQPENDLLQIKILGAKDGSARWYEDDGETMGYRTGEHLIVTLDWVAKNGKFSLTKQRSGNYTPDWKEYEWAVHTAGASPLKVICDGQEMRRVLYREQRNYGTWWFDAETKCVYLRQDSAAFLQCRDVQLVFGESTAVSME